MHATIEQVTDGTDLGFEAAKATAIAAVEEATDAQIGALLAALRAKGETEAEIAGFAAGLRERARTIEPAVAPLVDTCGTGGDRHDTINVSTASAIVVAAAGVNVAKHGNHAVSSKSGSADVLEELGVPIRVDPVTVERAIERDGIGFMHAPVFHPAMAAVAPARSQLGMRTIFNVLGPLTNPAGADAQLIGVHAPELVPVMARAVAALDTDRALVVHGDGLDEIALHGPTIAAEVRGSTIEEYTLTPSDLGVEAAPVDAVAGGDPASNAADLEAIVTGRETGPKCDIVLANAGAALYVVGAVDTIAAGVELSRTAVEDGRASATVDALRQVRIEP
ncbi:MAG: anthranilate phosphoribosyltransferase [Halobacteriota archaeon]